MDNVNTLFQSYNLFLETLTIKLWGRGPRAECRNMGSEAEDQEKHIPSQKELLILFLDLYLAKNSFPALYKTLIFIFL